MGKSGRKNIKSGTGTLSFYLGGRVVVGILSLALRTSRACEIYSSHGSDCEEHVFWHMIYISTRPHSITSDEKLFKHIHLLSKYDILWLYILQPRLVELSDALGWGVRLKIARQEKKKFELQQKHAPFLQYKHLDRSFTIQSFCYMTTINCMSSWSLMQFIVLFIKVKITFMRWKWVVNITPWLLYAWERDPVPIVQEAGWAPGVVWTGVENLPPPGFDPRAVQPVARCYTDYAIPTHLVLFIINENSLVREL